MTPTTILSLLIAAAHHHPNAEAIIHGPTRLTWRETHRAVAGLADKLRCLGAKNTRVALLCANSAESAVATLAIQAAGAVFCPMNPAYTARELCEILTDCQPHLAVCDPASAALVCGLDLGIPHIIEASLTPSDSPLTPPDPDAIGMIQYTGGTTGRPKGVMLTHRAIATNVAQREAFLPTQQGDRFLCMMPLFHSFALAMHLYQSLWCAGTLVILPRYRPDWVTEALTQERITVLAAGPTVFTGLLGYESFTPNPELRVCYSGSAALPEAILRRWTTLTGAPIYEGYGQTEAGPILTYNAPHFPMKPARVGRPLPDTTVQIVDVATGKVLPPGEAGEIRARGPQIMSGYWQRPDETAATLRDGWLYTGDIGAFDEGGDLAILDRRKDMVITGGYNVYPREIDEVLLLHPAVAEAAAFGVPDAYRGEVVHAHIVPHAPVTIEALLDHCRANLARYKIPAQITLVDTIPKTPVGKVDKAALKRG
jgi:long-chain acyl-CoA synthetase